MSFSIHFDPIEGIYSLEGTGVVQQKKYLDLEDVQGIFAQHAVLDTGLLPKNCIHFARIGSTVSVVLEVPATKRRVLLRRNREMHEKDIPLPNMVFGFVFTSGTLKHSFAGVTKMPVMGMSTELYRFPLGNVFEDNRICWGRTEIPRMTQIAEASQLPFLFFEAPFNGDLYRDANSSGQEILDHYNSISEMDYYPLNHLVKRGFDTIGEMVGCLKQLAENEAGYND